MDDSIASALSIEAFRIRRLSLEVTSEPDGETHTAAISLSYDFFRHETEANKYRISLKVVVRAGADDEPLFTIELETDGFVAVPDKATEDETKMLLTNGVALLYSTLRGTIAGLLGQTAVRGFVLPAIDMNKVARAAAADSVGDEVADD
jgi:preprotein translocase subunit SecB